MIKRNPLYKKIRKIAGTEWLACPIIVVDGDVKPYKTGEAGYYITKEGKRLSSMRDYASGKSYWAIYVSSTLKVTVGREWILQNATEEEIKLLFIERFERSDGSERSVHSDITGT